MSESQGISGSRTVTHTHTHTQRCMFHKVIYNGGDFHTERVPAFRWSLILLDCQISVTAGSYVQIYISIPQCVTPPPITPLTPADLCVRIRV